MLSFTNVTWFFNEEKHIFLSKDKVDLYILITETLKIQLNILE